MTSATYRICHAYDRGDQSEYVQSESDPTRAALFIQFTAEEQLGDSASVLNKGVALALVQLYGCTMAPRSGNAIQIDLYSERESRLQEYDEIMADKTLHRDGVLEIIKPHSYT